MCALTYHCRFVSPDIRAYLFLSLCSTVLGGTSKILNAQLLQGCSEYVFSNLQSDVRSKRSILLGMINSYALQMTSYQRSLPD